MIDKRLGKSILGLTLLSSTLAASSEIKKPTIIKAKAQKLVFSGTHYLGFVSSFDKDNINSANGFETRRNYFQLKSYFSNSDFFRFTLDTTEKDDGDWSTRLKYAYLYLSDVLAYTGIEMGQVHRPWIDYESHGGWDLRSINKVFFEDEQASNLGSSADLGFNLKTKTKYFSSEAGVFNGEGYHNSDTKVGLSAEYRVTAHVLGSGKTKRKPKNSYFDISAHGVYSNNDEKRGDKNWSTTGFHAVYNMPMLLIAGQYIVSTNEGYKYEGNGYSINTEIRAFGLKNYIVARYDNWNQTGKVEIGKHDDVESIIGGFVHKYNKNIKYILSAKNSRYANNPDTNSTKYMLTAEVNY
jgi:hypothetical protein